MKRYFVFGGLRYYPTGGWRDLVGTTDSLEDATAQAKKYVADNNPGWAHVLDTHHPDAELSSQFDDHPALTEYENE